MTASPPLPASRGGVLRVLLHPLFLCIAIAFALVGIGDQYPFSPFPMYSRIDGTAEVLFVSNEKDEPLPLSKVFGHGSAQLKKRFESNLQDVAGTKDWWKTTDAQRQEAATRFLARETVKLDAAKRAKYPASALKVWLISITMEGGQFQKQQVLMGQQPLAPVTP